MTRLALCALATLGGLGCVTPLRSGETPLAMKVQEEVQRDAPLVAGPASPLKHVGELQFLFIAGFLHEAIPGYFIDNMAVTKELGADASALFPSSGQTVSDTADVVRDEVLTRYQANKRPVVLVGHSKGGAEALLAVLRYPELVTLGVVEKVIVIQGALGGSPVADRLRSVGAVGGLPVHFGLEALTREKARALFKLELEALRRKAPQETIDFVFSKVFYVRACSGDGQVALELLPSYEFLKRQGSGKNDGLVLVEDQRLYEGGTDLGVLDSDHGSLTVSSFVSASTPRQRRAFTRALLREVFAAAP
jgi:pimeloyl-ACP methyl ester carboxylesterase